MGLLLCVSFLCVVVCILLVDVVIVMRSHYIHGVHIEIVAPFACLCVVVHIQV